MNTQAPHICVYYSEGLNYLERLRALRRREPDARICAMVPAGYCPSEAERAVADEIVEMECGHYSPRDVRACLRLVRRIRAERFDGFVVMFNSLQLRILAGLSGARRCACWRGDNEIQPLTTSALLVPACLVFEAVRGWTAYAVAWTAVHCRPVRRRRPPKP